VRVNAVSPGCIPTEIQPNTGATEEDLRAMHEHEVGMTPLGRTGEPADVATWILHAADPSASWFTGQVIGIEGSRAALSVH
jgi:NAD(P)-dependent dehydrogenase (short-subunit alcohol dehydrogenase family)